MFVFCFLSSSCPLSLSLNNSCIHVFVGVPDSSPRVYSLFDSHLQKFYLDLRKHHHSPDSTPITTRQLESLIRLTEVGRKKGGREEGREGGRERQRETERGMEGGREGGRDGERD